MFDQRLLGANATAATRDQWARDTWPHVELLWIFLMILHFSGLVHIEPLVLHVLSVLLKLIPNAASTALAFGEEVGDPRP